MFSTHLFNIHRPRCQTLEFIMAQSKYPTAAIKAYQKGKFTSVSMSVILFCDGPEMTPIFGVPNLLLGGDSLSTQ